MKHGPCSREAHTHSQIDGVTIGWKFASTVWRYGGSDAEAEGAITDAPEVFVLRSAIVAKDPAQLASPTAMVIHAGSDQACDLVGKGGIANADVTLLKSGTDDFENVELYNFAI
jgi:hypothetical protein